MDNLHATIALYLRQKRLPDRTFRCTRCNTIVRGGQGLYHLEELRLAGECAYCHGPSIHRAALGLAGNGVALARSQPLCKHCGLAIGGHYQRNSSRSSSRSESAPTVASRSDANAGNAQYPAARSTTFRSGSPALSRRRFSATCETAVCGSVSAAMCGRITTRGCRQ